MGSLGTSMLTDDGHCHLSLSHYGWINCNLFLYNGMAEMDGDRNMAVITMTKKTNSAGTTSIQSPIQNHLIRGTMTPAGSSPNTFSGRTCTGSGGSTL